MFRTQKKSFSLLQATAAVTVFATILWIFGVPGTQLAEAANITLLSDTLSHSTPTTASNHTITFVVPTGLKVEETISLEFEAGFTGIESLSAADIDLSVNGVDQNIVDGNSKDDGWFFVAADQKIQLTNVDLTVSENVEIVIEIGTNATFASLGDSQIINPTAGLYEIKVGVGNSEPSHALVAIIDTSSSIMSLDTTLSFTVNGVNNGVGVNGILTTGTSTSSNIPFGSFVAGTPKTMAQDLLVNTNAANGFVVMVQTDQQLLSSNGADIDGFIDGAYISTPTKWAAPTQTLGQENTYGHWGITSSDNTVTGLLTDVFDVNGNGGKYTSASTTPVEVFRHTGPADGTMDGVGITRVGYTIETSSLQEAANDYTATLTYVATPVF